MFALISLEKMYLPAGAVVRLPATWHDYQVLREQRGDASIPRMKYRPGEVLFMAPLPQHGRDASLLADIVKVLLDHLGREYDAFTPVTMELPEASGIEPLEEKGKNLGTEPSSVMSTAPNQELQPTAYQVLRRAPGFSHGGYKEVGRSRPTGLLFS